MNESNHNAKQQQQDKKKSEHGKCVCVSVMCTSVLDKCKVRDRWVKVKLLCTFHSFGFSSHCDAIGMFECDFHCTLRNAFVYIAEISIAYLSLWLLSCYSYHANQKPYTTCFGAYSTTQSIYLSRCIESALQIFGAEFLALVSSENSL